MESTSHYSWTTYSTADYTQPGTAPLITIDNEKLEAGMCTHTQALTLTHMAKNGFPGQRIASRRGISTFYIGDLKVDI